MKYLSIGILTLAIIGTILINGCVKKSQNQKEEILTNEDISDKIKNNQGSCYDKRDDYPKIIGKHSLNLLNLQEICFCSDYCPPEMWKVVITYENISSKEKCAEIGGLDLFDAAWGGYIGCAPNVK